MLFFLIMIEMGLGVIYLFHICALGKCLDGSVGWVNDWEGNQGLLLMGCDELNLVRILVQDSS